MPLCGTRHANLPPSTRVDRKAVILLVLAAVSIVAATASRDELAQCEKMLKNRPEVHHAGYFRLGHRLVREAPGQYTLYLTYFSSSRWLATCRFTRDGDRNRLRELEQLRVTTPPNWLPGTPAR
jgi:hypothetical protein